MQTDYTKQAAEILEKFAVTFESQLLGDDCPKFCEDARKGNAMGEVNKFPRKTHIHGKHYLCTFRRLVTAGRTARTQSMTIDFWNSYRDEEQNYFVRNKNEFSPWRDASLPRELANLAKQYRGKKTVRPEAYDVLACLTKNHPSTFEDFCSEYGYDTDSRSAFDVYQAVLTEWGKVSAFFSAEEIEQLQEVA